MPDDPRVQRMIEEMLDSGSTVEAVCLDTPELLPQVREAWRRYRVLEDRIDELFPEPRSVEDRGATPPDGELPLVPGYDLTGVLGWGGVGVVYKAEHLGLKRTVALKMLLAGAFATRAERLRFAREAELVAGLRHPNIVQVHDVGVLDGRPFFTMEFLEGGSLAERIAGTPRPAREAAELLTTLAEAIAAAHRAGIVHRDLKPSNVLFTADGTPKIADFGLARDLEAVSSLTQTGAAVGTPCYMAPEQAQGRTREIGPASDQYALGAVLYELLTGRPPFRAESTAETIHQVITLDPVPPSRLNASVPRDLETICLKCLAKDLRLRYADSAAMAEDLRRYLRGEAISARPENRLQRLARRARLRPAFSAAVAAAVLLAAILTGGGLWLIAERAAIEGAAEGDLREMVRRLETSSWPEARAARERAKGRLGDRGSDRLLHLLKQGTRDLELADRLSAIRLGLASSVGGASRHDTSADQEYEAAFRNAGIGLMFEAPESASKRVNSSSIRPALVAALDEWSRTAKNSRRRDWVLSVARSADPDPTGWRDRVRDPANWKSEAALAGLIEAAPVAEPCVELLLMVEGHWYALKKDPVPFLKKVQQAHPGDFFINIRLGDVLYLAQKPAEAVGYFQAALAVGPGVAVLHNNLGLAMAGSGRLEESLEHFRKAERLDPIAPEVYLNFVPVLRDLGRIDEAIEQCRHALRLFPKSAIHHSNLGVCLMIKGCDHEALDELREAVALDPKPAAASYNLRILLARMGRLDESREVWEIALADGPLDHNAWYGYAELCSHLGREEDYRNARRTLLARFGDNTNPNVAERTARACLLRPATEDEMRRILALGERAWGVERSKYKGSYPHFLFLKGLAEYRRGEMAEAISLMRGDASRVLGPAPRLVLAMALHRSGQVEEARTTLAAAIAAHDWAAAKASDQDQWIYHSLRREAAAMIFTDLKAFLNDADQTRDNDEPLAMSMRDSSHRVGFRGRQSK